MFADNMQRVAKQLIDKYGNVAFIVKVTQGGYDPSLGVTDDLKELHGIKAYLEDIKTHDIITGVVNLGDIKALFHTEIEIDKKDSIEIEGKNYNIVSIKTATAQDTLILYELVIRA